MQGGLASHSLPLFSFQGADKFPLDNRGFNIVVFGSSHLQLVFLAVRVHPFPFRTRKLSSPVPTILAWRRAGKIGQRQHNEPETKPSGSLYSSLAQSVEHAAVNRGVVCSSQTGGATTVGPLP